VSNSNNTNNNIPSAFDTSTTAPSPSRHPHPSTTTPTPSLTNSTFTNSTLARPFSLDNIAVAYSSLSHTTNSTITSNSTIDHQNPTISNPSTQI
jgi:hypothetical protein